MRVLVVEDYQPLANSLAQGLREAGYTVELSHDGRDGLAFALATPPDAVVLDVMLPGLDGLSVLKELRSAHNLVPVLLLTAKGELEDRVKGLDLGADDYLAKPFAFSELLARLRAIIRRRYDAATSIIAVGPLEVDTAGRSVRRDGVSIVLSATEFALLEYLALRQGQVVTRAEIWEHVYDFASSPSSNVVDVYIGYLRKKIDHDHAVKLIHTRRGLGYLLGVEG
jgi:DNA-binding response OmpR family regulator